MNFRRRLPFAPFVVLALVSAAAACGDDDDVSIVPPADGGTDATTPQKDASPTPTPDSGPNPQPDSGPGPIDAGPDTGPIADASDDAGDASVVQDSGTAPAITTALALPGLVAGTAATPVQLAATGSTPITYAITAGAAPAGMTLSTTGAYTGTATVAGSFTFTVTATNSAGTATAVFTQSVTLPAVNAFLLVGTNQISSFATSFPAGASTPVTITGVAGGDTLVSLDRRPQNNYLYAIGFNATTKATSLYAIDPVSNVANQVGATDNFVTAIDGPDFGIDFNPTVDRVRVVTSGGQNFRMNPNNGAFVDGDAVTPGTNRDTPINGGAASSASETAYTNNAPNSTIATQYTTSGALLYIQNPPNAGTLTNAKALTNVETIFGFDIPVGVNAPAANTAVNAGSGFVALKLAGAAPTQLASVNLVDGVLTTVGNFPFTGVRGLTLQSVERPIIALAGDGLSLVRVLESAPATATTVVIGAGGVTAGEQLVGIDFRPATGQLYGLGINPVSDTGSLYLIDPQTGNVNTVGAPGQIAFTTNGGQKVTLPVAGGWGFDFNPAVDRVRVVHSSGVNFRINPNTGAPVDGDNGTNVVVAGTNPDGTLSGGATGLAGVAYTNGPPATAPGITSEYGISSVTDSIHLVSVPNAGTLAAGIPIRLNGVAIDFNNVSGFDIPSSVTVATSNTAVTVGNAYAVLTVSGSTGLYRINLADGAATLLGTVGAGTTPIAGIAVGR